MTPEEPPAAIGIEDLMAFDGELDFLSYWLPTYGSIDVETLSIKDSAHRLRPEVLAGDKWAGKAEDYVGPAAQGVSR